MGKRCVMATVDVLASSKTMGGCRGLVLSAVVGYECDDEVCVETDNKGAHDLCHRFSSAQHTRHIDRKLFKLREMRGAGLVTVKYLGTEENTADIFTKILDRHPFEKHRKTVLNAAANDGIPSARDKKAMGAWPRRF